MSARTAHLEQPRFLLWAEAGKVLTLRALAD
jgi:hypothetical protein